MDTSTLSQEEQESYQMMRALQKSLITAPANRSASPSPAFRSKLTSALNAEWDAQQKKRLRVYNRPVGRYIALAAALVLVFGVISLLFPPPSGGLPGVVVGPFNLSPELLVVIGVAVIGAVGVGVYFRVRGRGK